MAQSLFTYKYITGQQANCIKLIWDNETECKRYYVMRQQADYKYTKYERDK